MYTSSSLELPQRSGSDVVHYLHYSTINLARSPDSALPNLHCSLDLQDKAIWSVHTPEASVQVSNMIDPWWHMGLKLDRMPAKCVELQQVWSVFTLTVSTNYNTEHTLARYSNVHQQSKNKAHVVRCRP